MTKTLVERLCDFPGGVGAEALCREAAAEIERLQSELALQKEATQFAIHNLSEQIEQERKQPIYRKWPGEPPHCMSCDCGMTDEQKRTVPEADYLRIHKELMDLKYPGSSPVEPSAVNSIVRMREALRWIADEGLSCGDYAACVHEAKAALSQPKRPEGET